MPRVSLVVDPIQAKRGWEEFTRGSALARRDAEQTIATVERLQRVLNGLRGAQGINVSSGAAAASAALNQQAQATERAAAASRTRATALDAEARALDRQIQRGITALSTLGGENRAYAQLTQFSIRRAQALGQEVDRANVLTGVQGRLTGAMQRANEVFSTGAVNARDLRVNMASLAGQATSLAANMTGLGGSLGRVVDHLRTIRAIGVRATGLGAVGGGSADLGGGAGGSGTAANAAASAAAVGGLQAVLRTIAPVAIAAGAAIAGVGVAALSLAPSVINAAVEMQRIEGRLRASTGDAALAREEFRFLREEADRLGLSLADSAGGYARIAAAAKGTNLEGQATRDIFLGIATASSALRLSAEETGGVLFAVEQIISKGKLSSEELRRQLGDRLPGAFRIAADAMGVTTSELDKMLQLGQVMSDDFLPKFAAEMQRRFGAESVEAAKSLTGQIGRLKSEVFVLLDFLGQTGIVDAFTSSLAKMVGVLQSITGLGTSPQDAFDAASARVEEAIGRVERGRGTGNLSEFLRGRDLQSAQRERDEALYELREQQRAIFDNQSAARTNALRAQEQKRSNGLRELTEELDKQAKATRVFSERQEQLNSALATGDLTQAEYNRLLALAAEERDKASKSSDKHAKALEKEAKAHERARIALDEYLEGLRQEVAFASLDEDSREVATARVEAYNKALATSKALTKDTLELARASADEAERSVRAAQGVTKAREAEKQAVEDAKKAREEVAREQERIADQQAELIRKPFENALTGVQEIAVDAFRSIWGDAEEGAKSFADRLVDLMKEAAAQIATLLVFRPIMAGIAGAGTGGGGFLSQLLSPLLGSGTAGGLSGSGVSAGGAAAPGGGGFLSSLLGVGRGLFGGLNTSVLGSGTFLGGLLDTAVLRGVISPGLGNAILGATTPLAGIGGLLGGGLASLLGLGGGGIAQTLLGSVGSIGGGLGGAALGAALGLPFGGPIGAAIGGFLGVALSGLLPKNRPDHQELQVYSGGQLTPAGIFEDGAYSESPFGRVGILGTKGTQVGQAFSQQLANFFGASDRAIAESLTPAEIERVRLAIEGTLGPEVHTRGKAFGDEAIATVVQSRLAQQFAALGLGQQLVGIEAQAARASGGKPDATYLEALSGGAAKFLAERRTFLDSLEELEAGPLGNAEQALKRLNEQFDQLAEAAEVYGESAERVEAARAQSIARARDEFDQGIQDAYLQLTNPAEAVRVAEQRAGQQRIDDAIALGADLNAVYQLNALVLQRALEQAYEAQVSGIREFIRAATATTASPLAPQTVLANAQLEYQKILARAQAGDQAALAQFPTVADALIGAAQAMYASGPAFAAVFEAVVAAARELERMNLGPAGPAYYGGGGAATPEIASFGFDGASAVGGGVSSRLRATKATQGGGSDVASLVRETSRQTATLAAGQEAIYAELAAIRAELASVRTGVTLGDAAPPDRTAEA